jgi:hypothetical protein
MRCTKRLELPGLVISITKIIDWSSLVGGTRVSGETEPSHSHALDGPSIRNGHDQFPSKFPDASMARPGERGVQSKGSDDAAKDCHRPKHFTLCTMLGCSGLVLAEPCGEKKTKHHHYGHAVNQQVTNSTDFEPYFLSQTVISTCRIRGRTWLR